ncbi:hypothetical protein HY989_04785 [Candidatus Micrarchaeota archaeon]|nr:hypothetical protein [Candidatus Micrarchaeota archaeon]
MKLISSIAAAFKAFGKKNKGKTQETYFFDRRKGAIDIRTDQRVSIKLDLFKRFTNSKDWGFELTVRNKGADQIAELLIIFNRKFSIIFDKLRPDTMKIKSLQFSNSEFDSDTFQVDVSVVTDIGGKAQSEAYSITLPMDQILRELKAEGNITPVSEEENPFKPGDMDKSIVDDFAAVSMRQATIKPRVSIEKKEKAKNPTESLKAKLAELENQKNEIQKSFMKREIDYATFSQLMNPIVQESILIKAKLSKLAEE